MQSRRSVVLKGCILLGAVLTGMSGAVNAQQFKLNLADPYGPNDLLNQNMSIWVEDIKRATNGAVQITVHTNGSLFKAPDIKRAVQTGQIEFGSQLMQSLGPEKRLFEIDGLPFLARNYDEVTKLWDSSRPYVEKYLQNQGLRVLYAAPWPSQAFFYKKEINSLADLKGMRQRAPNELTSRLAQHMGATPTTVQAPEITQAMTTGTIHTFTLSTASAVHNKLWEVASHYYDANAWLPKQMVMANEQAFQKLPKNVQQAILEASKVAEKRGVEMSRKQNDESRAKLAEMGMKGGQPSPTFMRELAAVGEKMRAEWLQKADDDAKAAMAAFLKSVGR